jgi:HEAT repeat protein
MAWHPAWSSSYAWPAGALHAQDWSLRRAAVGVLGQIGDAAAMPGLLKALRDPDREVHAAAKGLGQIGSTAVPGLLEALRDPDWGVRLAAVGALGQIGDAAAVPGLLKALRDLNPSVRTDAAQALGRIVTPEARAAVAEWRRVTGNDQQHI